VGGGWDSSCHVLAQFRICLVLFPGLVLLVHVSAAEQCFCVWLCVTVDV
jgi:hypothetical protein